MSDPITPTSQASAAPAAPAAPAVETPVSPAVPAAAVTVPPVAPAVPPAAPVEQKVEDGKEAPTILNGQETPEQKAAAEKKLVDDAAAAAKAERQKDMTPEQKAADDAKIAAELKAKEVPADGKYDYKLAEGLTMPEPIKKEFDELLAGEKLTNGQAQKIADVGAKLAATAAQAKLDEIWAYRAQEEAAGVKAIKGHPEYGGINYDAGVATANRGLRKFGREGLIAQLEKTRLGSNADFFDFCYKVGKELGETAPVKGSPDNKAPVSPAKTLFGDAVAKYYKQ